MFTIERESPAQPEVGELLGALDLYLGSLYPPEANHILDVAALQRAEVTFLVARDAAGHAVATGAYRRCDGDSTDGLAYAEIKRMFVDPARRGLGLGARMLAALEARARDEGLAVARLETGRDQPEAVRLYESAGFSRCAAFGGYPDNGLSLFYAKDLSR